MTTLLRRLVPVVCVVLAASTSQAQTASDADFDASGKVDFADFLLFARAFNTNDPRYDLDVSGRVAFQDFLLFVQFFGQQVEASPPQPIEVLTTFSVRDVPADTAATGVPTYYSLRTNRVIPAADSASTEWDLAFRGTTVLMNGGSSGPGQGGAIVMTDADFETVNSAPDTGYVTDEPGQPAISGWYTYTGPAGDPPHAILANEGVVIVVRTADGHYAKLQFTSYYKGGEAVPSQGSPSRFYSFTYTYQPDGSRTLSEGPAEATELFSTSVHDLPADTASVGIATYFSLRTNSVVPAADSTTTRWDLAFRSTTILTNSGTSGPGEGGALVLTAVDYDTLSAAPETGYREDEPGIRAISSAWYTYTGSEGFPPHSILMNPGVVTIVRSADGRFAKVRFTSYYEGGAAVPEEGARARFYHFDYTFQPDGGRRLIAESP